MPYLTCPTCRLPTYYVSEGTCPACGTPLRRPGPLVGPHPARHPPDGEVRAKLAMACRELDADAALLSEIRDGHELVRWGAGEDGYVGASIPLSDTICERLLDGRIGSIVADTAAEPSLRDLPAVREGSIGAYIGVSFGTADARAYVLCCLARETRTDLADGDARFLQGLAESLRFLLEPTG